MIWETKLDDTYDIRVDRAGPYEGTLSISRDSKLLAQGTVSLAYGAQFGPDVSDVAMWQDWSANFVDGIGDTGPLKKVEEEA